jgi:outer membrane lipoprotein carrier protein
LKKSLAYLAITWLGLAFFVNAATASGTTLDKILDNVEKRYASSGFSAKFDQTSTLRAVQITDTASGKAYFQYPGNMRWEYETPDKQYIITNNDFLWIYSPADNQLMKGNASQYFGDGKGASFLSDISLLRKKVQAIPYRKGRDGLLCSAAYSVRTGFRYYPGLPLGKIRYL